MNWIDYGIFTVLFFATVFGLASGPVLQFLRIGCLLISFFTALLFHDILSNFMRGIFTPSTANLVGYFIVFGVAFVATYIVTDLLKRIIGKWGIGLGLRLLGGLLGTLKGLVFCGIIIFGVSSFCSESTRDTVDTSKIAKQIGKGMSYIKQAIISSIPENVSNKMNGYADSIKKKNVPKNAKPDKDEDFKSSP